MKIIDAHMHAIQYVAGIGAEGELRFLGGGKAQYADGRVFQLLPEEFASGTVTPEDLIAAMDRQGVEKGVLLQGHYLGFQNIYSLDAQDKYPDRFRAAVSFDPWSRKCAEIRDYLVGVRGAGIIKYEVSTGSGLMCNHPTFDLFGDVMRNEYNYCDERGLICVLDIGKCGTESWQPKTVRKAALAHPGLKLVICHLLAPSQKTAPKAVEALKRLALANVWFDLAALPHNMAPDEYPYPATTAFIRRAIDIVGAEHLIFGSDFPSTLTHDTYAHLTDYLKDSGAFSQEEQEAILYRNADLVYFGRR